MRGDACDGILGGIAEESSSRKSVKGNRFEKKKKERTLEEVVSNTSLYSKIFVAGCRSKCRRRDITAATVFCLPQGAVLAITEKLAMRPDAT